MEATSRYSDGDANTNTYSQHYKACQHVLLSLKYMGRWPFKVNSSSSPDPGPQLLQWSTQPNYRSTFSSSVGVTDKTVIFTV
jgi:hypothetical protein